MKKKRKLVLPLLCALVLSLGSGQAVSAEVTGIISEKPTLPPSAGTVGELIDKSNGSSDNNEGNNNNSGDNNSGGNSSGGGSGGEQAVDQKELENAINTVTQGGKINSDGINAAAGKLKGLSKVVNSIIGIAIYLIGLWIPVTFVFDFLVAFMPFLDRYVGSGSGGGGSAGPGGNGGKGFHFQLTSGHNLRGGSGGGPGGPGGSSGGWDFGGYAKSRFKELIYCFVLLGLIISGQYLTIVNLIVKYIILIVNAIVGLVTDILSGFFE